MQYSDKLLKKYTSRDNGESLLLFNTELHDQNNDLIYAVGKDTDEKDGSDVLKKWKRKIDTKQPFMTAQQIKEKYGLCGIDLPTSSRIHGNAFVLDKKRTDQDQNTTNRHGFTVDQLLKMDHILYKQKRNKHDHNATRSPREISVRSLKEKINAALDENDLISVILFDKNKKTRNGLKYNVDKLLAVEIFKNEWVGIIFHNDIPIELILDEYDILNKIQLCDPSQGRIRTGMFRNTISKLTILNDDYDQKMLLKHDKIRQLEQALIEQKDALRQEYDAIIQQKNGEIMRLNNQLDIYKKLNETCTQNNLLLQLHIQNQQSYQQPIIPNPPCYNIFGVMQQITQPMPNNANTNYSYNTFPQHQQQMNNNNNNNNA